MPPLIVEAYSKDKLSEIFSDYAAKGTLKETVERKDQYRQFVDYFESYRKQKNRSGLTIVIEPEYVDRNFLSDYAGFYVNCFTEYKRYCARIHFFSFTFTQKDLDEFYENDPAPSSMKDKLVKEYIGHIIIKGLPKAFIGKTCLEPLPQIDRRYLSVKKYEVSLNGLALKPESLAFQEQDRVAAACATSALWSAFQKTGALFHHKIMSPMEITHVATRNVIATNRIIPSCGLVKIEVAEAIRQMNLEPYWFTVDSEYTFKALVNAYLRYGIPILMTCHHHGLLNLNSNKPDKSDSEHLVVITGYKLGGKTCKRDPDSQLLLRATKIDEIYVHDDQIGPFSVCPLDKKNEPSRFSIATPLTKRKLRYIPNELLMPLYHKIRIPFTDVYKKIVDFDLVLREMQIQSTGEELEWDIYLSSTQTIKTEILSNNKGIKGEKKRKILEKHLPRFVWRAEAYNADKIKFELLFDCTGFSASNFYLGKISYSPEFTKDLSVHISTNKPFYSTNRIYRNNAEIFDDLLVP